MDVPLDALFQLGRPVQDTDDREGNGIVLEAEAEDPHKFEGSDDERVETSVPDVEPFSGEVGVKPDIDDRVLVVQGRAPVEEVADGHDAQHERD